MSMRRTLLIPATLGVMILALSAPAPVQAQTGAEEDPELAEWDVPWGDTRPRDPYVAPDGRVWFVGQRGDYVAVLDPESGDINRHDLPDGAGPHNLIVADDGMIWYAGNRQANIGRVHPETGEVTTYPMPDEAARDPHTLVWDHDGNIWFTVQGGNMMGKFWPETGEVRLVEAPRTEGRGGQMSGVRPYGIKIDENNEPWIALFGTNLIGHVDNETFELTTYELPEGTRPRRLGITSDQLIWYVDYAQGNLGRLDPSTGEVTHWPMPSGSESRPYGMAIDDEDRIWFVETGIQPNRFVGFDPESEEFFSSVEVASGGGTIRHMYYDAQTQQIWFGTDANTVGRAELPPSRPVS